MRSLVAGVAALTVACTAAKAQVPPAPADLDAYSGLHAAVVGGSTSEAERLVRNGADVNARDGFGRTSLMIAAYRRDIAVARALIALGANVNALDHQSYDAITVAAVQDDLEMLRLILKSGGNARAIVGPLGGTALIAAARRGNAASVEALIDARAPVDHADHLGGTALLEAIEHAEDDVRYLMTVKVLVAAGADPGQTNRDGKTPLALAQGRGLARLATLLPPKGP